MPIQSRTSVVPRPPPKSPKAERGEAERRQPERRRRCGSARSGTRAASHLRAQPRSGARASRGSQAEAREQRDEDPDEQRDDDRPRLQQEPLVREREADRVEELEEPLREREAGEEADDRRERSDDERLDHDRAEHLPPRAAERPDGRELARALGDRDRERVRDHEAADEECDAREGEQEALQERDELVRVGRILRRLLGGELRPPRSAAGPLRSPATTSVSETPGSAATAISSNLPALSKIFCAVGRSKPASVAPPIVETEPNRTMPEMRSRSTGPLALHADHLADREVLLVGRGLVDHDLAGPGPATLDERRAG